MAEAVYILCALTSFLCAVLLLRSYQQSRARLALWSGLCFLGLLGNNVLLLIDEFLIPGTDLTLWRNLSALAGLALLLFGLIWDGE
jgi:hypothetical protein